MSKKSRKEGNRVACLIKANKTEFYISDVDLGDNSDDVVSAVQNAKRTLGKMKSSFMVISGGVKNLTVVAYVPDEHKDIISSQKWVNESLIGLPKGEEDEGENYTRIIVKNINTPFKLIDTVRGNGFAYLNKNGCMEDESSDEYMDFEF